MSILKVDACFNLGYIIGTYGLAGEVRMFLDTDQPENYQNLESVFLLRKGEKSLIPFFIQSLKLKGDKAVVKFEEVLSKESARQLIGSELYLPLDLLPPVEGDDFYYHELVNWKVNDRNLGDLGIVGSVNHQLPQTLLVMEYKNHEVLIPFTDEIVLGIDREGQKVLVSLPDGLLDVYLEK